MSTLLLATKLHIPLRRIKLIPRPRLVERLNEGLDLGRKLTLVSAPAGFGKTALVADWLRQTGWPCTWISLDEGDNDPHRFLAYIGTALQEIKAGWGHNVQAALYGPELAPPQAVAAAVLNQIASDGIGSILTLVALLNHLMGTSLTGMHIATLETRTGAG